MNRTLTAAVLLALSTLATASNADAQDGLETPQASEAAVRKASGFSVDRPAEAPEGTPALAVVLASSKIRAELSDTLGDFLNARGYIVLWESNKDADVKGRIDPELRAKVQAEYIRDAVKKLETDADRTLLVVGPTRPLQATYLLETHAKDFAGVVWLSSPPMTVGEDDKAAVWEPDKAVWNTPMWVVAGTKPPAPQLLLWRRVLAGAPKGHEVSLDLQMGRALDVLPSQKSFTVWIKSLREGKTPRRAEDAQVQLERRVYKGAAKSLRSALEKWPEAPGGEGYSNADGGMQISVTAPQGWKRLEKLEGEFAEDNPFVQLYVTGGSLYARLLAGKDADGPAAAADAFIRRMQKRGSLVQQLDAWKEGKVAYRTVSTLWPTRQNWRRALMLIAARPADDDFVSIVVLVDASRSPGEDLMATAMKQLVSSVKAGKATRETTGQ